METTEQIGAKAVVVLGSVSTIARAVAGEFAKEGYEIVLGDPDREENEIVAADLRTRHGVKVHALDFDALAFDTHEQFLDRCREVLGDLPEGLVACFGYMTQQADTQTDFGLARLTIDINFTGAASILNVFANAFEARKGGFICMLSSVAGDRGRQGNYTYGAAKAGLTAYLSGLRNRLHASNVQVTTVKPGFMDTKMTYGMDLPGPLVATPEQAGKAIHSAIKKRKDVAYVLWMWRYIMLIIRSIPEWQFKKMDL